MRQKFKKRATALILYVYKDSETAFRLFLSSIHFPESVPKNCGNFGKKLSFHHKNANISKTIGCIIKNSTPIAFFRNFTYYTKFLSKSDHK